VGETNPPTKLAISGGINLLLIAGIIVTILATAAWKPAISVNVYGTTLELQNIARDAALVLIAILSLVLTPNEHREANDFTWEPIAEVAILFAGIFVCIIPVVAMLDAGKNGAFAWLLAAVTTPDGSPNDIAYFWLTGALSAFLDNAPTYLVFFEVAGGDARELMGPLATTLAAISMGAVYMGAMTYIGNAPNLMIYAIAVERGVKMPSFFGFMLWSAAVLLPVFAALTVVLLARGAKASAPSALCPRIWMPPWRARRPEAPPPPRSRSAPPPAPSPKSRWSCWRGDHSRRDSCRAPRGRSACARGRRGSC
jgi:Na+/H+ antiporter NhaD/arsenite permease-like protein